jgi:hypothetical protein
MNTSFLEYYQQILDKVHFDINLFMKEYRKAKKYLTADEQIRLDDWLRNRQWSAGLIPSDNRRNSLPKQRLPYT